MTRFILLLALLTAFPPLSTDMYLPSIPHLQNIWGKPLSIINLTLVCFFVTYCFCLIIYGPLSDRFGRRPPLIFGLIIFISGCFLCSISRSVEFLIASRIIQASGAASASSISMAMAKDRFKADKREKVLGYVSVIMAFAPMIAPMIGSLILTRLSWNWVFILQALLGLVALTGVFFTPESNKEPNSVSIKNTLKAYVRILKKSGFMSVVICTSVSGLPFFAFIAASSTIYINQYKVSEEIFSLLFGANALCFMAGAMVCARFGRKIGSSVMLTLGFFFTIAGGILMLTGLFSGPMALAVPMGFISFCVGLSRPPSNNIALEQVRKDAGAASSVLVFIYFMFGAASMWIVSLGWEDKVRFIAILSIATGSFTSLLWLFIKSKIKIP